MFCIQKRKTQILSGVELNLIIFMIGALTIFHFFFFINFKCAIFNYASDYFILEIDESINHTTKHLNIFIFNWL